jgi:DNA invertase Pin-like site-specific DNA recombinase
MNKIFNYIKVSSEEQNDQRQVEAMSKWNQDNNIEGGTF